MSSPRLRVFEPLRGKLVEVALPRTELSALARAPLSRPYTVVVGCADAHCDVVFRSWDGDYAVRVLTTQARKLAEGAVWLGALHAVAALAEVAAAALELDEALAGDDVDTYISRARHPEPVT